jgi:N-acetylglutamate synthase-like GNAT family acetyltransferase
MGYELIAVAEPADWADFHTIRRQELFEAKGRFGIYNADHPDDRADFAHPYLLRRDGKALGVTRLDIFGEGRAAIRLVAITAAEQGNGHGRVLAEMVEQQARGFGVTTLLVNAAPTALGYYEKIGWQPHVWDATELVGLAADCIQMRKLI